MVHYFCMVNYLFERAMKDTERKSELAGPALIMKLLGWDRTPDVTSSIPLPFI